MRFLVLIAAMLPGASIGAAPEAGPREPASAPFRARAIDPYPFDPAKCPDNMRHAKGARAEARKLGDLPSGDLHLAVVREVDGCPVPTVVRQGIGGVRR